jgi:hypothetical protein
MFWDLDLRAPLHWGLPLDKPVLSQERRGGVNRKSRVAPRPRLATSTRSGRHEDCTTSTRGTLSLPDYYNMTV